MASNSNALHLVWDNHLENVSSLFQVLYQDNKLVDVTLACQDGLLRAHKLILSACSPYFERIFHENPCKHPVVIMRGVHFQEMQLILEYIYKGYIDIPASFLNSLICIASELEIKGFENFRNFQGNYQSSSTLIGEQYNEPKSTKHREDGIEGHTSLNEPINNRPAIQEATERSASSNINLCRRETRLHGKRRIMVNNPYNFDCDSSFCNKKYQKSNSNSEETEPVHNILNSETLLIEASKVKEKPDRPPVPQFRIENVLIDNQWMDTDDSAAYEEKSNNDNDEKDYDFNLDNESTDDVRKTELICGVCFYKCRSKKDLLFHQKSHMKTGKPHKCEFCPSSFTRSSHLARHRRMHTGERPFNCLTCGKTFARQDKLKQHTRTSHVKTKTFLETTINEQETKEVIENNIEIPKPVPHYEQEDQNRPMLPIIKTEKRKRGRPRKYPIGAAPAPMPMIGPKRGRGRPRKIKIPVPEVSIPWENIKEECRSPVADHDNNFSLLELSTDEHIAIEPLIEIRTEPHQLNLREDDNHHSPMIDSIYQSDIDINITAGYSQKADDENLIKSETNLTILNENVTIENIIETNETPINQNENERTNNEVFQTNDNIVSNIISNSTDTDLIELSDKDVTTEDDPLKINEQSVETNEGLIATTEEIIKNNDIIADELIINKDSTSVNTN